MPFLNKCEEKGGVGWFRGDERRKRGQFFLYRLADIRNRAGQIGFLTEWQLYAQKIEGDSWVGEKLDPGKIEKMSGESIFGTTMDEQRERLGNTR